MKNNCLAAKGAAVPILFSTPMVKAILSGQKKMTRRIVKTQPETHHWNMFKEYKQGANILDAENGTFARFYDSLELPKSKGHEYNVTVKFPYGAIDSLLWVRETWRIVHVNHKLKSGDFFTIQFKDYEVKNYSEMKDIQEFLRDKFYAKPYEIGEIGDAYGQWKPSIFMPKVACRIYLKITDIRTEKLQDISEADAFDEGTQDLNGEQASPGWGLCQARFEQLWKKINGEKSWNENPYVWVIQFERAAGC